MFTQYTYVTICQQRILSESVKRKKILIFAICTVVNVGPVTCLGSNHCVIHHYFDNHSCTVLCLGI